MTSVLAATLGVDEITAEARVSLVEDEIAGEARNLDVPLAEDFGLPQVPLERWRSRLWEERRKTLKILIRRHEGAF
jgi:hypothetical protein